MWLFRSVSVLNLCSHHQSLKISSPLPFQVSEIALLVRVGLEERRENRVKSSVLTWLHVFVFCCFFYYFFVSFVPETNPRQTSSLSADPLDMFAADDSDANEEELLSSLAFDQLSQPALRQQSSDLQSIPQYSLPISLSSPGVMSPLEPSLVPYQDPSK